MAGESTFQNSLYVNCLKFHKKTFKLGNKLDQNNPTPKIQSESSGCRNFYLSQNRVFPKLTYKHTRLFLVDLNVMSKNCQIFFYFLPTISQASISKQRLLAHITNTSINI